MTELSVLQAVRLKGRVTPADLAKTLRANDTDVTETVGRLAADGLLVAGPTLRITPEGRAQLAELLAAELRDALANARRASRVRLTVAASIRPTPPTARDVGKAIKRLFSTTSAASARLVPTKALRAR